MNQKQVNTKEMMEATNSFLDANTAVWNAIPKIAEYKNELSDILLNIDQAARDQDAANVFIGTSIREIKRNLAIKMDILDDVLEAYADDIGDDELLSQASNTYTDYFKLTNSEIVTKVENVIGLLESNVSKMRDFGMTKSQIDDAKLTLDSYQTKLGNPRAYQIASSVATKTLEDLFKQASETLEKIDRLMKRFKRSNITFYNGYQGSRKTINR